MRGTRHGRNRKRKHKAEMINAASILNGAAIPPRTREREAERKERVRVRTCNPLSLSLSRLSRALYAFRGDRERWRGRWTGDKGMRGRRVQKG